MMKRIAVVTGANRGIGLEICRQLAQPSMDVLLTSRDREKGVSACNTLVREGLPVQFHALDVTSSQDIDVLKEFLTQHGGFDILINNAGVALRGFNADVARTTLDANFFGPLRLTDALLPLIKPDGRIVMVTSGMGDSSLLSSDLQRRFHNPDLTRDELSQLVNAFVQHVSQNQHTQQGWPSNAYSVSKMAVNALTQILGRQLHTDPRRILCNAACPGWVRTDMGGPHASRTVQEGADTPVWLALLPPGSPTGRVFRDRAPVNW